MQSDVSTSVISYIQLRYRKRKIEHQQTPNGHIIRDFSIVRERRHVTTWSRLGMEPAIARWAVNLNEASGTKTWCDFMSKLMSTRRHPSVTTWNQSISSSRPGQCLYSTWTVERTLRTHSSVRADIIGSFRAPRSLKSKTPYWRVGASTLSLPR